MYGVCGCGLWRARSVGGEFAVGQFQIRGAAHVQPRFVHRIDDGSPGALLQAAEQGRHVAMLPGTQGIERTRIEHVDAGIDMTAGDWFFLEADYVEAADVDD